MKDKTLGVALVKEACPLCGRLQDGPILMNTRLTEMLAEAVEDLNGKVIGYSDEPCATCTDLMTQGFLLIGIDEDKSKDDMENPYRSGQQWVISNEAAESMFDATVLTKGAAFIDTKMAEALGFPLSDTPNK